MLYLSLDALLRDTRIAPKLRSCSPRLTRLCETNMMFTPRKCKARMRMHVPCKFYSTVRVRVRARRVESAPADRADARHARCVVRALGDRECARRTLALGAARSGAARRVVRSARGSAKAV